MVCPSWYGPHPKQLIERHGSLHDVATGEAECALQVEWAQHLTVFNCLGNIWSITRQQIDATIGKILFDIIPVLPIELVRRVLNEHRHDVFARRSYGGIDGRW